MPRVQSVVAHLTHPRPRRDAADALTSARCSAARAAVRAPHREARVISACIDRAAAHSAQPAGRQTVGRQRAGRRAPSGGTGRWTAMCGAMRGCHERFLGHRRMPDLGVLARLHQPPRRRRRRPATFPTGRRRRRRLGSLCDSLCAPRHPADRWRTYTYKHTAYHTTMSRTHAFHSAAG
jgi:hypothetical protein